MDWVIYYFGCAMFGWTLGSYISTKKLVFEDGVNGFIGIWAVLIGTLMHGGWV
jgi:hypothetical protein